jgi:hypothetical protein
MKTSNCADEKQPRLACRAVQGWVSLVSDGERPHAGAWGARHVEGCARCQEIFARSNAVTATLRAGARRGHVPVADGLDRRISAAVRRASGKPAAPPAGAGVWAWAGIGAFAVLALVALRQPVGDPVKESRVVAVITDEGEAVVWDEGGGWAVWQPKTEALLEGEPLRREADALYADARVALGFLALNFLPTSVAKAGEGTE